MDSAIQTVGSAELSSLTAEDARAELRDGFIDAGCVRVNGHTGRAETPRRQGDTVHPRRMGSIDDNSSGGYYGYRFWHANGGERPW
ncbi:MAG: hypothetical protein VKK97_05275 [Synechococcaceae cyanobacterium]|nr:hypothetical protein [Synechococcaceae cyanobacterium]